MSTGQPTTADLRANFLSVADNRNMKMPRQTYVDGGLLEFPLPHAGFANYLIVDLQATITLSGAGGASGSGAVFASWKAPFNIFKTISLIDYLGTTRINCSGYGLYEREVATKWAFDISNAVDTQAYSGNLHTFGVGGGFGAVGSYTCNFSVVVPIALHDNTTEGSYSYTLPQGDNVLGIQLNTMVGATNENPIKQTVAGWNVVVSSATVGVQYYYWDVPTGTPLPTADFSLVHEIRDTKDATGLLNNTEKLFTMPTGRTFMMIIENMVINDSPDTTDVSEIRFLVDGNTPYQDELNYEYLVRTRRKYGRDFPVGMFLFDFWRKPWTPASYGSLQTGLTLNGTVTVTGNSYTNLILESMYKNSGINGN